MENIREACLLISRSNGGINRDRSELQVLREMQRFLDLSAYHDELPAIDEWLGTLTPEQFEIVCDGDQTEAEAILADAPTFTDDLLNDYFLDVC